LSHSGSPILISEQPVTAAAAASNVAAIRFLVIDLSSTSKVEHSSHPVKLEYNGAASIRARLFLPAAPEIHDREDT